MNQELQLEHDEALQRREWKVQRVAWWALCLFLLLALLGVWGQSGPLNRAVMTSSDDLKVEYERFGRYQTGTVFRITAKNLSNARQLLLDGEYWEAVKIDEITPDPSGVQLTGRKLLYQFDSSGPELAIITLYVIPQRAGLRRGRVSFPTGPSLEFAQLVYP
jgi:hypothetical protein